jgi:hypothetical protein
MKKLIYRAILALFVSTVCTGTAATVVTGTNAQAVAGTWVLQQVGSVEELRKLEPAIADALQNFDTVGFCLRFPWKVADADFALLERGREIATRYGKKFSVRFMAGRHTPERVFNDGCPYYVVPGYGGRPGTDRVPAPMMADGAPNTIFEKHYRAYVTRLAEWCRRNDVRLLHLAWYGQDWAELNNGLEVRAVPGYSYDRWFDAHTRLIDIGLDVAGPDLATEFPFSGHGPSGDTCSQFADHVWARAGANPPHFFFQGNGWGPDQVWGSPNREMEVMKNQAFARPVNRGLQMIQPQDYDWAATFAHLYAKQATYAEVYVPSFALANKEKLKAEIARFAAHCLERNGPVAPRGEMTEAPLLMRRATVTARPAASALVWTIASPDDLKQHAPELKSTPGAKQRLQVRMPWSAADDRYALLDAVAKFARERGVDLTMELLAGPHTPKRVFAAGAKQQPDDSGRAVPLPFDDQGRANQVFEREYEKTVAHVASWCRLNEVGTLVLPDYRGDWSGAGNQGKLEKLPGYSAEAWTAANARITALGRRQDGRTLRVEFN